MNGQPVLSKKEKDALARRFIANNNPYDPPKCPSFDLRGYSAFLKQNDVSGKDVTPQMMNMFAR